MYIPGCLTRIKTIANFGKNVTPTGSHLLLVRTQNNITILEDNLI